MQEEKTYILDEKRHLEERLLETVENPLKGSGQRRQIEDLKEELYKAETCKLYLNFNHIFFYFINCK